MRLGTRELADVHVTRKILTPKSKVSECSAGPEQGVCVPFICPVT